MKILHVITDTNFGGAGRYLTYLLPQAAFQDHEILVACPDGELGRRLDDMGIRRIPISGRDVSFSGHLASELTQLMRRERPDVVHTHGVFSGRIAARLTGTRIVYTKHGSTGRRGVVAELRPHRPRRLKKFLNACAGRMFSDAIIAVSAGVAEGLVEAGVERKRVTVIRNGINLTDYSSVAARRFGTAPGAAPLAASIGARRGFVVGTMARFDPQKGLDVLIDAAKIVLPAVPSVRFVIAGAGPIEAELVARIRRQRLESVVKMTGFVDDAPGFLAGLDVYVAPSRSEGLGLAIIEAMASGLPVVATSAGGIPEVVEDGRTGILVTPGEPAALAQGIVRMLVDPQLAKKMGHAGRARAEEMFDAAVMAEETMKVYRKVSGLC